MTEDPLFRFRIFGESRGGGRNPENTRGRLASRFAPTRFTQIRLRDATAPASRSNTEVLETDAPLENSRSQDSASWFDPLRLHWNSVFPEKPLPDAGHAGLRQLHFKNGV
ncbi:MAG: hypothetical protein LBG43_02590 [Treponema sp.]|nr:hypothetical protein [Treponema sp.]